MSANLYDADILEWSEHQAELLRRVAAGEPVNEAPDWPNIAEELADVGRSELRSCRSLLRQALRHMLKALAGHSPGMHRPGGPMRSISGGRRGMPSHLPCGNGSTSQASTPTRSPRYPKRWTACPRCRCRMSVRSRSTSC